MKNISKVIVDCCKRNGINYCSSYLKNPQLYEDALRLRDIYLQLKEISADLQEIAERHKVESMYKILEDDILKIEKADHDVLRLAQKLIKEK